MFVYTPKRHPAHLNPFRREPVVVKGMCRPAVAHMIDPAAEMRAANARRSEQERSGSARVDRATKAFRAEFRLAQFAARPFCWYCGVRFEAVKEATVDHLIPRSRGGAERWNNFALSCQPCNARKGNRTPAEAGMALIFAAGRTMAGAVS